MGGANYQAKSGNSIASTNGSQYFPEVQQDRARVLQQPFNAESSDYDYATAEEVGMLPSMTQGENFGHMGSVTGTPDYIYQKYKEFGLPAGESYLVLKGASHPTHDFLIKGEAERGFEVKKFGDRYFSVPKQQNNTTQNMGGLNTQTANATQSTPLLDAQKEQQTYEMLDKQKMSGYGEESPQRYGKAIKGIAKEVAGNVATKASGLVDELKKNTPNFFGRDFSKPMSADDAIEKALKESESKYGGN